MSTSLCCVCGTKPVKVYATYALGASCPDCDALKYKRIALWSQLTLAYRQEHNLSDKTPLPGDAQLAILREVDTLHPVPKRITETP